MIINISFNANYYYVISNKNYIKEFVDSGDIDNIYSTLQNKVDNYEEAIEQITSTDKSFYRIAKDPISLSNISLIYNYNSISSYLSIGDGNINKLSSELEICSYTFTRAAREFDNRSKITTLLGTKYFITDNENTLVPYGYKTIKEIGNTKIYQNEYSLPIGFMYNSYITKEEYEKSTPLEKEDTLFKTAVIEKEDVLTKINMDTKEINNDTIKQINSEIIDNSNIVVNNNEIKTTKKNQKIKIKYEKQENAELYVYIKNLEFVGTNEYSIIAKKGSISKTERIRDKETSAYYFYNPDIVMNLGYSELHEDEIEITFSTKGDYTFDEICVYAVSMEGYDEQIASLRESSLGNVEYGNDYLKGNIEAKSVGILYLSVPYSKGWKAYVDGKKVDTFLVNTAFTGIELEQGSHEICLEYETPYIKVGIASTITGIVILFTIILMKKKKNNKI